MNRSRAALGLIWLVVGTIVIMNFVLTLMVARTDYQVQSYADLCRLENLPAIVIYPEENR